MITRTAQIDQIMAVMEAAFDPAFGEAWNRRQVSDALSMPSTHALLMDRYGDVIPSNCGSASGDGAADAAGFVLSRHAADEEELLLIAVVPGMRRTGIGDALVQGLFQAAKTRGAARIFLEMRRGNPAEHLYRKAGFEPIGERSQYYCMSNGDKVDAITFGRPL